MTIKAKERPLNKIFGGDYVFKIPDYQRPYTWNKEHTKELLDDLLTTMAEGQKSYYFLGSIVLIKEETETRAEVVDGQQRLTTLTMLLCVLRELTESNRNRDNLHDYVRAKGKPIEGIEDHFHLSLRERDREMFRDKVQAKDSLEAFVNGHDDSTSDSQRRIRENAKCLWDKLAGQNPELYGKLASFLMLRCYLVVVSASDQESAYRIFSVMNDRGLNLSATDILKAEIIGGIERRQRTAYSNKWVDLEDELGREGLGSLFTHIRMIYFKSKARKTLIHDFREGILRNVRGVDFIGKMLMPMAHAYWIVSKADYKSAENPEAVNSYLTHLGRIDNSDWVPPAIAFFCRHQDNHEALATFVRDLERVAYAMFILRWNINERIRRYAEILQEIEQGMELHSETSRMQLLQEEKDKVREALDGPIYLQKQICKPLLLRLDKLLAESGAVYTPKVISIEHVLPQTPRENSVWLKWFPDLEQREMWTHRLANLVLLSRRKNSKAQNFDFQRKKREYFQRPGVAPFAITSQVLQQQDWTPEVLEERQQELTGYLASEWRL